MTSKAAVFLMAFSFYIKAEAQFIILQSDIPSIGLAGIQTLHSNHWTGLVNPASLAELHACSVSAGYLNYYRISEVGMGTFDATLPLGNASLGCGMMTLGYSAFRQYAATTAIGKSLGRYINAGIGIHYLFIDQASGYTHLRAWIPSVGIQVKPFKNMIAGAFVFNPAGQNFRPSGYMQIPVYIAAGIGYHLGEEVFWCMEIERAGVRRIYYSTGVEMLVCKALICRFGIRKSTMLEYAVGLGVKFLQIHTDISVWNHPILGMSPSLAMTYTFK